MLTKQQLDSFKPWIISVIKTGSQTLDWITGSRDCDYIFYVVDNTDVENVTRLFAMREKECWGISNYNYVVRPYSYQYNFAELVYGDDFPKFNIFDNLEEYKRCLIKKGLNKPKTQRKDWYHVLTGIYFIDNGEFLLTEQQKDNINLCHDKKMTTEIYEFIQQRLQEYADEQ